jgi:hypothetical protein
METTECVLIMEGGSELKNETYYRHLSSAYYIFTQTRSHALLYHIPNPIPIEIKLQTEDQIVTGSFIDEQFLIVGNNYGEILIFSLRDGAYIRSESP